jgi:hypothetical protein
MRKNSFHLAKCTSALPSRRPRARRTTAYVDACGGTRRCRTDIRNQAPLPGGHTCLVLVDDLPDDSYFACKVTASNVTKLRGTVELAEGFGGLGVRVLAAEELR